MQYHPDKNPPNKKVESEKKIKAINEAYETLGDKKKREMYDLQGADGSHTGGASSGPRYGQSGPYQQPSTGGFTFTSGGFPGSTPGGNQWFDPSTGTFSQTFTTSSFGGGSSGGGAGAGGTGGMGDIFEMMERMFGGAGGSAGGSGGNPFGSFSQMGGQQSKSRRSSATGPNPRAGPGTGGRTGKTKGSSQSGSSKASAHTSEGSTRSRKARSTDRSTSASSNTRNSGSYSRADSDLHSHTPAGSHSTGRAQRTHSTTGSSSSGKGYADTGSNAKPVVVSVECTLEDLYAGKVKSLRVKDKLPVGDELVAMEKVYKVEIKPGYKSGTKVKFPASQEFPRPVEFEITEVRHKYFTRVGDNLHWTCKLTSKQVSRGVTVKVPLLDGSTLELDSKQYDLRDGAKVPFAGKGMPLSASKAATAGRTHGDLIVKFEVV